MKRQKSVLEETKTKKLKERKGGGWINSEVGLRRDEARRGKRRRGDLGGEGFVLVDEMKKSIKEGPQMQEC